MSDDGQNQEPTDKDPMAALLKRSMGTTDNVPDLVGGVQQKLRVRSKGRFYGDGWSTGQGRSTYLVVALVMLVLIGAAFLALGPWGLMPSSAPGSP